MTSAWFGRLILCAWAGLTLASSARAGDLAAQLTRSSTLIETATPAAPVALFGHVRGGGDIVISVTGPARIATVRRKSRIAAIWLNSDSYRFDQAPSYYALLSARPLAEILSEAARLDAGIGLDAIDLAPDPSRDRLRLPTYRAALERAQQAAGLYQTRSDGVSYDPGGLFHANLAFPSRAPTGIYHIVAMLVRDGRVVERRALDLSLGEGGTAANLASLASTRPIAYGVIAVSVAAMAGWCVSILLRSVR